ncbi:hypothetical protein WJX81_000309 [Elliptochloris bilobata]|uniref:DNA replication licensing factor MCM3 n=1 Tax=Elliptochloris bilobata TaxID=381761 RepID=A0AAW1QKM6_9CHLO
MDELSERRLTLKRDFGDFLDEDHGYGQYPEKIKAVITKENVEASRLRLLVDLQDLQNFNQSLHHTLLTSPGECLGPFEEALGEIVRNAFPKTLKENQVVHVGVCGELGDHHVSPRQLTARLLSHLVEVEGIVTKTSLKRPKLVRSVHYCEKTAQFTSREYRDATSHEGLPTGAAYPTRDDEGNLLTTEFGLCLYKDHQVVTLQELPETAPPGQLPRSTEVIVEDDLVDACKPGDRVSLAGVYRAVPPQASGAVSGVFRSVLVACSVRQLVLGSAAARLTAADVRNIEALAAQPDVLEVLARSLAPSIYGHHTIKLGLVLQLLGGRERNLANGTHLRGDINCLMVGDPGVAKSQLLRAVMNVAPLAVSTTGRGSSGVGLTAAITHDSETGERKLEAGAMVLADRGVVCIDEFDKMNDADRVAIHEVMEQQTVTIAKAGIQTSLNARCSVVAAANPLYGSYDHKSSITKNINLPDSLLSRFDLLFVVLDNLGPQRDREIAEHVLGQHRYRAPGDDGFTTSSNAQDRRDEEAEEEEEDEAAAGSEMYVKYDARLHGPRVPRRQPPLTVHFLKKFLTIVKRRSSELSLSGEAMEAIGEFYCELRGSADLRALPITVRTLETIIRLSTAAAKARLAKQVEVRDVAIARGLMRRMNAGNLDGPGDADDAAEPDAEPSPQPPRAGRARPRAANQPQKRAAGAAGVDGASDEEGDTDMGGDENDAAAGNATGPAARRRRAQARGRRAVAANDDDVEMADAGGLEPAQKAALGLTVSELLRSGRQVRYSVADLMAQLATRGLAYAEPDVIEALKQMEDAAASGMAPIMYDADEGMIYEAA